MTARFDPRRITAPHPGRPLAVMAAITGLDGWAGYAFALLIPEIRQSFHLSLTGIGAVTAAAAPVGLLLRLPIGYLGDRRRRTAIAAAAIVIWALSDALVGLAPTVWVLVIATVGLGVGVDGDTMHRSLLSDTYPPTARPRVLFAYQFANFPAQFLAVLIAGAVAGSFGWRAAFLVAAPAGVVLAVAMARVPEPSRGSRDREMAGDAPDATGLTEDEPGFGETFRVLRTLRSLRMIYLAIPFVGASMEGVGFLFSSFLHDRFGLSTTSRGISLAALVPFGAFGLVITGFLVQRRMGRDENDSALRLCAALTALSVLAPIVVAGAPNLFVALVGCAISSFCFGGISAALYAYGSVVIPPRMRTLGFAVVAVWELPAILGLPLAGALADAYGVRAAIALMATLGAVGAWLIGSASGSADLDVSRARSDAVLRARARQRRAQGDPILVSIRDLRVDLGGATVLDGIELDIADGELVALVGTNGAGKTTLMRTLAGLITPQSGVMVFDGTELSGADPAKTVNLGLAYAPGGLRLFDSLTVAENLRAAAWALRRRRGSVDAAVEGALELFPVLRGRHDVPAAELSGGERQILNLAQSFLTRPRLALLDELTLGLSHSHADQVHAAVRTAVAGGATVVVVEQSLDRATALATRIVYLDRGKVVFDGPTAEFKARPDVVRSAYLSGGSRRIADRQTTPNEPVLEARSAVVTFGGVRALDGVNLCLRKGEILGVIGPNGAGKSTLLDVLAGAVTPDEGSVILRGEDVTRVAPHERVHRGLGRTFQDARLWPNMTVTDAVAVMCANAPADTGLAHALVRLPEVAEREVEVFAEVDRVLARFGLAAQRSSFVGDLSTGQRKILEVACLVAARASVMLLDEPAGGIAQHEVPGLARLLTEAAREAGCSMLIVEHDLALVRSIVDRLVVLRAGVVIADGAPGKVLNDPEVRRAYLGATTRNRPLRAVRR